jgi:phage terminase large subunit-like protein
VAIDWKNRKSLERRLEDFGTFCHRLGFEIEDFQRTILRELFGGRRELLVLIPRGNGKTTLLAAAALYLLLATRKPAIYVAASSRDQALLTHDAAKSMIRAERQLEDRITVRHRELRVENGFLRILASDAPRAHGLQPTFALVDELHAHKNDQLYVALKTAMGKREGAQLATISTAGFDLESTLGQLRERALELPDVRRDGSFTTARGPGSDFAMLEWACSEDDDLQNPEVVKRANPASFVSINFLREQIHSPGLHPLEFARYHANLWTDAEEAWLPMGAWEECLERGVKIPDQASVYLGVDIGTKKDTSALTRIWEREDGKVVAEAEVFRPRGDTALDLSVIEAAIHANAEKYDVRAVVYDRWSFERSAQDLSDRGLLTIEMPQSPERMSVNSMNLYEAILQKTLVHAGDPILTAHVRAGATKQHERGWRLVKSEAKRPIDALIALALAYSQVVKLKPEPFVEAVDW